MTKRMSVATGLALAVVLWATPVWAQQRPLVTEDPEVIGAGRLLL